MSSERDSPKFDALYEIESICNAFEKASRSGQRPAIEDFLPPLTGTTRSQLLRHLIEIDVACRREQGEKPSFDEYLDRFPSEADVLRECLPPQLDSAELSFESTITQACPSTEPDEVVTYLGRYELTSLIGKGGFGQVWQARDPRLRREVAIKTLRSDRVFPQKFVDAFLEEGLKLAQLEHPSILPVYDVGQEGNRCFIVSMLIHGKTLEERLASEPPLPHRDCVEIVAKIADALHHAHKKGIVHRDIKPSNILLDNGGGVYLADFGLAVTEEEQLDEAPSTLGTYAYMSPEQVRGSSHLVDSRSDIYSLGVVMYRVLAGRTPYLGRNRSEWEQQIQSKPPRPLRTIKEEIPSDLEEICLKCLHKDIDQRYRTASDLAAALRQTLTVSIPAPAPSPPAPVHASHNGHWIGGVAIVAIAAVVVALLTIPQDRQPEVVDPADDGRITPHFIKWPAHDPTASYHISPDGSRLEMTCEQYGMVVLGEVDDSIQEFSVDISQIDWAGSAGIFWGWHLTEGQDSMIELQTIRLNTTSDGDLALSRARLTLDRIELSTTLYQSISEEIVAEPDGTACRLTLRFDGSALTDVEWGGKPCMTLADGNLLPTWIGKNESGPIGLFVSGVNASFSDPMLDGQPLLMRDR